MTIRTRWNSTCPADCSKFAIGRPCSPARMTPKPNSIEKKMIASMSPSTSAWTILTGMMPTS